MNVLAHSMGNRVLQGIFQEIKIDTFAKQKPVRELVLAAADVEKNIFETDFRNAPAFAERVHVFYHSKDRMLRTGAFIIGKQRLGLNGPQLSGEKINAIKNLYLVDATGSYNWKRFEPSNHIYFYWSPAARKYLSQVFSHHLYIQNDSRNIVLEY
jgi:esterase/lipase superfamily enzyme